MIMEPHEIYQIPAPLIQKPPRTFIGASHCSPSPTQLGTFGTVMGSRVWTMISASFKSKEELPVRADLGADSTVEGNLGLRLSFGGCR